MVFNYVKEVEIKYDTIEETKEKYDELAEDFLDTVFENEARL